MDWSTHMRELLVADARGTVLSSGEPLSLALRAEVEEAWKCEVFDHWGMTETGYGGGVECSGHKGYHLREADLWLEVADPRTGLPLPTGADWGNFGHDPWPPSLAPCVLSHWRRGQRA